MHGKEKACRTTVVQFILNFILQMYKLLLFKIVISGNSI